MAGGFFTHPLAAKSRLASPSSGPITAIYHALNPLHLLTFYSTLSIHHHLPYRPLILFNLLTSRHRSDATALHALN